MIARPWIALLGPQRFVPTVADTLARLECEGPLAVVTAGWQEREDEDRELRDHVGRPVVNLELYRRAEDVFARDPDLFAAHRRRQDRLLELQDAYRMRLGHAMAAARELLRRIEPAWALDAEREDAIAAVRALDEHHLARLETVHRAFRAEVRPSDRVAVAEHRSDLAERLAGVAALAVAGGHVAILLNRLRLFDVLSLAPRLPVIAWSAGAMAISRRVVAFHDSPPQGPGNAEVLDAGLGAVSGVTPLPHAERRLRLDDPVRVGLLARRLAPDVGVAFDPGARVLFRGDRFSVWHETRVLAGDGRVTAWRAS